MDNFLNPKKVLDQLELDKEMTAVDLGCGSGSWVLPLAEKLEDGQVAAIDILEEPLSALEGKAKQENLSNIKTILADVEKDSKLDDESSDLVLITNLLFEIDDKKKVLNEAKRILKPGGKILVVDWKPDVPFGPKEGRISLNEIKKLFEKSGLKFEKELDSGAYHFALLFEK